MPGCVVSLESPFVLLSYLVRPKWIDLYSLGLVNKEYASQMRLVLRKYHHARDEHLLHMETFVTVQDYLFLLRRFTMAMSPLKENAMYYLAAAVSDFFIPQSKMVRHSRHPRFFSCLFHSE